MNFWIVESKFNQKNFEIHSLHRYKPSAVDIAREIFDSFPHDREGDGVRLRRGRVGDQGLVIHDKVFWMKMCETMTLADWMQDPEPEPEEEIDEFAEQDSDYVLYA